MNKAHFSREQHQRLIEDLSSPNWADENFRKALVQKGFTFDRPIFMMLHQNGAVTFYQFKPKMQIDKKRWLKAFAIGLLIGGGFTLLLGICAG